MKYLILIGDGMGDFPLEELGGKTPLQAADTPGMDFLARNGELGLVRTVPDGFEPGSDVANLCILGYDPRQYYTGRGPLEAGSLGIRMAAGDVAFRCNLVTLEFKDGRVIMADYSAGHISTEEARSIIHDIQQVEVPGLSVYPGVSYRHLLIWDNGDEKITTAPPHDHSGKEVTRYWNVYESTSSLSGWISRVMPILKDHPVNRKREQLGKNPANGVWLWGQGRAPRMPKFSDRFGVSGGMISAVDLLNGIGIFAGLEPISVPGATGYLDTNYRGKAEYALAALKEKDLVVVHVEAPDEASHCGSLEEKIKAIESFDREVVRRTTEGMAAFDEYRILLVTDHYTPVSLKTHVAEAVPFAVFSSQKRPEQSQLGFNEIDAKKTGVFISEGHKLVERLL